MSTLMRNGRPISRVFGFDMDAVIDGRRGLRDTPPNKMDVVLLLGLAIQLFVARPEHPHVHVEAENLGVGNLLFDFDGLFDPRDAADARTVSLIDFFIPGAYAVQKSDGFGGLAVGHADPTLAEHAFDIDRGIDVVVEAVAVLLFAFGGKMSNRKQPLRLRLPDDGRR